MPTSTQVETPRKKKRRLRILWMLLLSPAVLLLVTLAGWMWHEFRIESQIEAEEQKIRDLGQPVTVADLQANYALPEGVVDRSAAWLEVVTTIIEAEKEPAYLEYLKETSYTELIPPGTPWPGEQVVAEQMRGLEPTFERLAELAKNPAAVRYPLQLKEDRVEEYGILIDLRAVPRTLTLRARWHVYHGRSEQALESLLLGRRVADSLEDLPASFTCLMQIAFYGMMSGTARELLPHANWSEAQLKRLQGELLVNEDPYRFVDRAIVSDRVLRRAAFENPSLYLEEVSSTYGWTRRADELHLLRTMARQFEANQLPADQARARLQSIREELEQDSQLHKIRYPLSREAVPHLGAFREACERLSFTERAIAALIACQRYRLRTRAWPEQLTDVTPNYLASVPLDPFDGKPLRYQQKNQGIVIWSVGYDFVDDHAVDDFSSDEPEYFPDIIVPLMLPDDNESSRNDSKAQGVGWFFRHRQCHELLTG